MRSIDEVVIHASATKRDWMENEPLAKQVMEIRRWHTAPKPKGNGWSDIGYHFIIGRNGQIMAGRPVSRKGAHVKGHNDTTIGVCLIGGHGASADDDFYDHFTAAQDKALQQCLDQLQKQYPTIRKITGHNQYANKGCPGFRVPAYLDARRSVSGGSSTEEGLWAAIVRIILSIFKGGKNAER